MAEKPKALRLADFLEDQYDPSHNLEEAAAELRRLHVENERLHQINQSHEMKLSVRGYEIQIADLEAVNAKLLEALKKLLALPAMQITDDGTMAFYFAVLDADTAITKAEGEEQ